jgi:hypothetical protein
MYIFGAYIYLIMYVIESTSRINFEFFHLDNISIKYGVLIVCTLRN